MTKRITYKWNAINCLAKSSCVGTSFRNRPPRQSPLQRFLSCHRNAPRALKRSLNYFGWSLTGDTTVYLFTVRSCSSGNSYEQNMGIFLRDSSGTITTPGFPQGYDESLISQCFWKILAPTGNVVRVDFISFSLADSDYVTIAVNPSEWNLDLSIKRYGQKASFTVFSMGNELSIGVSTPFYTGTSGQGFVANFTSVPTGKTLYNQRTTVKAAVLLKPT